MTAFRRAICDQPENLAAAGELVAAALESLDLAALRSGTVVVGAIGASHHAAIPFVRALRAAGRRAFLLGAEELASPAARSLGDGFVLVSQSGRSRETIDALRALDGAPVVAVSARSDSPLAGGAAAWLPLGPAPDTPVATLSYTATLQTLGMLAEALVAPAEPVSWGQLPGLAAAVLADSVPGVEEIAEAFTEVSSVDAVGGRSGRASAAETALLIREGLGLPASGMGTREYLHGPMESVGPGLGAIVFGGGRELRLARDLASFGAQVMVVGDAAEVGAYPGAIGLPAAGELAAPILQILPVQLLAERVAAIGGVAIGELSRSQPDTKVSP